MNKMPDAIKERNFQDWIGHNLPEELQEMIDELAEAIEDEGGEDEEELEKLAHAACVALLEDCGFMQDAETLNELFAEEEEDEA